MMPITKTLALWAFAPLLAAGTLLPLTAHQASAESLTFESKDRDAATAAQSGIARPPQGTIYYHGHRRGIFASCRIRDGRRCARRR